MRKRKHKKLSKSQHTPLAKHARAGKTLIPPLNQLNTSPVDWQRDFLPEHLWISALAAQFGLDQMGKPFHALADAIDTVWPPSETAPFLGLLSDFSVVPETARAGFRRDHADVIERCFLEPFAACLAYYSESPVAWLVKPAVDAGRVRLDLSTDISRLRAITAPLLPGKDPYCGRVRALPVARMLKHGRIKVPAGGFAGIELFSRYPTGCTDAERASVEQQCRMFGNMYCAGQPRYASAAWPKYFWRHNTNLALCQPVLLSLAGGTPATEADGPAIASALEYAAKDAREYVSLLNRRAKIDLYDPTLDEVRLGLLSRSIRLFVLLCEDCNLWARDTSGIMLRCLADTVITFVYLVRCGTPADYKAFRDYGDGQEKLLMLHLQDTHEGDTSVEGRSAAEIADALGGFAVELTDIELGAWSKSDTRTLANKAGLEKLYRLVFTPSSGDVHGTWASLKSANLCYCKEPLHRFHRLPALAEPPLYLGVLLAALEALQAAIDVGVASLHLPQPERPIGATLRDLGKASPKADEAAPTA